MFKAIIEKAFFIKKNKIISPLSSEGVIDVLKKNIKKIDKFSLIIAHRSLSKSYEGYIIDDKFFVRKLLKGSYSAFSPIIIGKMENNNNSTNIYLVYKLHPTIKVILFSLIFFFVFLFLINLIDINGFSNEMIIDNLKKNINNHGLEEVYTDLQKKSSNNIFFPLLMMIFSYTTAYVYFWYQVDLIKMDLYRLFTSPHLDI